MYIILRKYEYKLNYLKDQGSYSTIPMIHKRPKCYVQRAGFGNPAILVACLAGPSGNNICR